MNIDSNDKELYKKLGLRVISDKEFQRLQDNISDFLEFIISAILILT